MSGESLLPLEHLRQRSAQRHVSGQPVDTVRSTFPDAGGSEPRVHNACSAPQFLGSSPVPRHRKRARDPSQETRREEDVSGGDTFQEEATD